MIPLTLFAIAEAEQPYVVRLRTEVGSGDLEDSEAVLIHSDETASLFASKWGMLEIRGLSVTSLIGDVVLVEPGAKRVERLLRSSSDHNTLLVTERCDQLCVMCSQPPKKTHVDRFASFQEASLMADPDAVIGISGGEPTLYKAQLLGMLETVLCERPDLSFHVLTNGQHFDETDIERLRNPLFLKVQWGIPLYGRTAALHDEIVGKIGAFDRLQESLSHLMMAGASIELRTVLLSTNIGALPDLARYVVSHLRFVDSWSIMQLENIGFAKNRWTELYVDHRKQFGPIAEALDYAILYGVAARLFNFARCTVPAEFRDLAAPSISDWKRRYAAACELCDEKARCCGFFEWHPDPDSVGVTPL